jgi:hypothetical protein
MAGNWIAGATSKHKGLFARKAARAGESTSEFAREKASAPGALGKEARLAATLGHLRPKRKRFGASPFSHK